MDIRDVLDSPYLFELEQEIEQIVAYHDRDRIILYGIMRYCLGWVDENLQPAKLCGGKKVRPLICLLVGEALGADRKAVLPAAAAVELIHNGSLIIVDAYDNDLLRRGRPTAWSIWGVPQAVLAGLAMQALMNIAVLRLTAGGIPGKRVTCVLNKLTDTLLEMCEGQYLDMDFENASRVSTDAYLDMISKKTAALIECAACCGALVSTDDEELIGHYQRYGRKLGIAFQLTDDILGVWGQMSLTGKPQGSDFKNKKKNLPFLYAMAKASPQQREHMSRVYAQEVITDEDSASLAELLSDLGSDDFCRKLAVEYAHQAEIELRNTGIQNAAQDVLAALALFAVERLA